MEENQPFRALEMKAEYAKNGLFSANVTMPLEQLEIGSETISRL
jgi:hypothetical protein